MAMQTAGAADEERRRCVSLVPRQNVDGGLVHANGAGPAYREVVAFPALADPHGDVRTTERNVARQVHDKASFDLTLKRGRRGKVAYRRQYAIIAFCRNMRRAVGEGLRQEPSRECRACRTLAMVITDPAAALSPAG
jgi:hypothetical protein